MRIVWSDEAFDDLERLIQFLRPKNPQAADRAYLEIRSAVMQLIDFPEIGRLAHHIGPGFRELPVPFSAGGYVVLYFVDDYVLVARVKHMREDQY